MTQIQNPSRISKYLQIFQISWENNFIYRLNFVMWRVRMVIQLLTIYFLWSSVLKNSPNAFGYTQAQLLTYIIGVSLVRAVVFSSKSTNIQNEIASGDLNNHLIRPFSYFTYWFTQDIADKLLNILFAIGEITLLYFIIQPPLVPPASLAYGIFFVIAAIVAMVMFFNFSLIVSLTTFWMPEGNGWPQRFFVYVMLEFVSGGLFPLDILPEAISNVLTHLPFAYMLHTPLQIYLGRISFPEIATAFGWMAFWLIALHLIARHLFHRGRKIYGAYGR